MQEEIVRELKELRRGHGVQAHDVVSRVGPRLLQACAVAEYDSSAEVRRKLTSTLTKTCEQLPVPLRHAAEAALAMGSAYGSEQYRFLRNRVQALAVIIERDPRTALRRIDQAFAMLGEILRDHPVGELVGDDQCGGGWYTDWMRSTLNLDVDPVEVTESRRIVSTSDDLDTIVLSFSVPKDIPDASYRGYLDAEVLYGGSIIEARRTGRSHSDFVMRLPSRMTAGMSHEYEVSVAAYPRQWLRRYYVITPWRPCRELELEVCFGTDIPTHAWRIRRMPPITLTDEQHTADRIEVDTSGRLRVHFSDLQLGMSYGVGWRM